MKRDPRSDPQPGDILRKSNGMSVKVTARSGEIVHWVALRNGEWRDSNSWSVAGWKYVNARSGIVKIGGTKS